MKQIVQDLQMGKTQVVELPIPMVGPNQIGIRTSKTLISSGTERMLIDFSKASLLGKARQQPEKVKVVFDKIKTDGLVPTIEAVTNKLGAPMPLGYSNVGHVVSIGKHVSNFAVGDRVLSNGPHAEYVSVSKNLCVKVPDDVSDEEAVFGVIGAIALQSIRLINPTLGETVAVFGLGLVGLLTIQLLRANGCRVIGIDFDKKKLAHAQSFGAEIISLSKNTDPVPSAIRFSRGRGVDAVIIATATDSDKPIQQAAQMSRKRGRVVLVGTAGLKINRTDFFEKEITFQVSCSYGPGRYDQNFEDNGVDYPFGFVRWTEQRNFEAVLDSISDKTLKLENLVSNTFNVSDAPSAYEYLSKNKSSLGIIIEYNGSTAANLEVVKRFDATPSNHKAKAGEITVGVLGAGNYASRVLIPCFKNFNINFKSIVSASGLTGHSVANKFDFQYISSDANAVINDPDINTLIIATRHDSHASYTLKALQAGKNIFVEKPLCITLDELDLIKKNVAAAQGEQRQKPIITVGFNRRFSPHIKKIRQLLMEVPGPKTFILTVNAGDIPSDHWTQNKGIGGGRIIGEMCHFLDLLRFLADQPIKGWRCDKMSSENSDTITVTLTFFDGSLGTIHYFSNGHRSYVKERIQIFAQGRILELDNFRSLRGYGWNSFSKMKLWHQDKGQNNCVGAFLTAVKEGTEPPIPLSEIFEVSKICIEIANLDIDSVSNN